MKLRAVADQIQNRFNNAIGAIVFSIIVIAILYFLTKFRYTNLLITYDILFGVYWIMYAYIYRIKVQITLLVAGLFWLVALVFVIIGKNQFAETIVNNMYILLVIAVVQQISDIIVKKSK